LSHIPHTRYAYDGAGVLRAVTDSGVCFTYEREWRDLGTGTASTAAANLRTVSKGSSRGAGPKVKQGRVRREGGAADYVAMCLHGQRQAQCSRCGALHCGCPGSPAHQCKEAAR
jgi:hypothetical protein